MPGCLRKGTESEKVPGKTAMRGALVAAARQQHSDGESMLHEGNRAVCAPHPHELAKSHSTIK